MNNSLIINIRQQLHWHQRFFSDSTTAIMWGMWLYLWRPLVVATGVNALTHPLVIHVGKRLSTTNFEYILAEVLGSACALILWNRLPARRVKPITQRTLTDYARHFELPKQEILAARAANICTVYHDAHGKIVGVTPLEA